MIGIGKGSLLFLTYVSPCTDCVPFLIRKFLTRSVKARCLAYATPDPAIIFGIVMWRLLSSTVVLDSMDPSSLDRSLPSAW